MNIAVLDKVLSVVEVIARAGRPLTLAGLKEESRWPKPTLHRILSSRRELGYVTQTVAALLPLDRWVGTWVRHFTLFADATKLRISVNANYRGDETIAVNAAIGPKRENYRPAWTHFDAALAITLRRSVEFFFNVRSLFNTSGGTYKESDVLPDYTTRTGGSTASARFSTPASRARSSEASPRTRDQAPRTKDRNVTCSQRPFYFNESRLLAVQMSSPNHSCTLVATSVGGWGGFREFKCRGLVAWLAPIWFAVAVVEAQPYDLLLKGGHVIDAKNAIDAPRDVAIAGGKIAAVAPHIAADQASTVIDATGLYVVPGFIDLHAHVFTGTVPVHSLGGGSNSVWPDAFMPRTGVTTAVDAGGSGWRNFEDFKRHVIDRSQTRILAFLNIVGYGMSRSEQNLEDMDPRVTADFIRGNRADIVGIKTAHWRAPTWLAVDRALEAGRLADVPIMVDFGTFFPHRPFEELVGQRLRPGDIYTHLYLPSVPMLDERGRLRPYLLEAQKRGVIFDAGHGQGSFSYRQAVPATRDGFWPNTISTDIHGGSMIRGMKDMTNVMSKFLNLGLPLADVVARSTWAPARAIKRPELGHLSVGADADVAVFAVRHGKFGFVDIFGGRADGDRKIECELTLRDGAVVWDLNGISLPRWQDLPPDARAK